MYNMAENPFVFGTVVRKEEFTDRKNEVIELVSDLSSKTNLIIFSPRRYGKTSLIFRVIEKLQKKNIVVAYIDMYPASTKEKFAEIFATAIAKAKASKFEETLQAIKDLIPPIKLTVRPEGTEDIQGGIEIEFTKGKKDVNASLAKLFDLPEIIAKKKKKKLVVVFDEFQEISNLDGEELEKTLRSKIQFHKNVSYVFMGSQRSLLDKIFSDKNRPLYRAGKPFNLGKIPKNEFSKFIIKKFNQSKIKISKPITAKILDSTESHPYYTQQLCHEIWNICKTNNKKTITDEIITSAMEQVMKNQNHAYSSIWDPLVSKQRGLLVGMATTENPKIYSSEFVSKFGLASASATQRSAQSLEERGILEKEGNDFIIADIFFKKWIAKMV